MMRETGAKLTIEQTMLASMRDYMALMVWMNSADGAKGRNRPKLILPELLKDDSEKLRGFESPEAFFAYRDQLLKGG